jgi:hypothetical protein
LSPEVTAAEKDFHQLLQVYNFVAAFPFSGGFFAKHPTDWLPRACYYLFKF